MGVVAQPDDLVATTAPPERSAPARPAPTRLEWQPAALTAVVDRVVELATPRLILAIGLPILVTFMALTALDAGGQIVLWENAHWTTAGLLAAALPASAAHRAAGIERRLHGLVALGGASWLIGQLFWDLQTAIGFFGVPAPSDVGFLLLVPPVFAALVLGVRGRLQRAEEVSVYLDAAALFLAITAVILAAYGDQLVAQGVLAATVTLAYPILHLATAGAGLVSLLATRAAIGVGGGYVLLVGFAILGLAWTEWLRQAMAALPPAGSVVNYLFSIGMVCVGFGGATLRVGEEYGHRTARVASVLHGALPIIALLVSAALLVLSRLVEADFGLVVVASFIVILLAGIRQSVLAYERGRLLGESGRARMALEDALVERAAADTRYRVLVERVPAAVYIDVADAGVTDGGRLAYMSPQIEPILGYAPEVFVGDPELWPSLIHPDDRVATLAAYKEHFASGHPLRTDYRMLSKDGSVVWVHDEAYLMTDGHANGGQVSQGLLVNTTDQKRLEAQLLHDALHDPLTGLANRVLFRDHLERALARRQRRKTRVAILFLDLDDFKVVNDSLGHRAGDRLLVEVAHRLSGAIRAGDIAGRQGGDEFTILLEQVRTVEEAVSAADRIADAIREPIDLDGRSIVIASSIGIAIAAEPETGADDLLAHADAAMYVAKADGKARHAVFDPSMRVRARSRLEMEAELRAAIDEGVLELHYQPIIALQSNRIVGFEALARWPHPVHGMVQPAAFIPLAEETGLIAPLGRFVTTTACRQLREWIDRGVARPDLTVSVNVSPRQASEPGFGSEVAGILADTGLAPASLILEITESLMLHESSASDGALRQLRDSGVHLVVDDFGTGFSALEYFKRFAVQGLKIDRSFVDGLGRSREDSAIVTATLAFASALGLSVTAEGVETQEQLEQLRAMGCQQAQGYLFARPIPAADVPALLAEADALAALSARRR